jgi:hypothetical protein
VQVGGSSRALPLKSRMTLDADRFYEHY